MNYNNLLLLTTFPFLSYSLNSNILEKIYHSKVFEVHEITNNKVNSYLEKHLLSTDRITKIPILGCGPTNSLNNKEEQLKTISNYVDFATIFPNEDKTCLLSHLSLNDLEIVKESNWDFEALPPILKIHQSIFETLEEKNVMNSNKEQRILNLSPLSNLPTPEGSALTIQYVRNGLDKSIDTIFAEILESWSHHTSYHLTDISNYNIHSRWFDSNSNIHSKWTSMMNKVSTSHLSKLKLFSSPSSCLLPSTTTFEHESSVTRLNDLSGWEFSTSTKSTTDLNSNHNHNNLKHSNYCFMSLLETIASHPDVLEVNIQGRPILLNYDARGVSQSGNAAYTPFSDLGLYGEGHIVGVTDSGIDDYSCYFWDNSGVYSSSETTRSSYSSPKVEGSRRKVIEYIAYADGSDTAAGHGTHVVGTIVGNSIFDGYTKANGVAPAAKVAFYDVMSGDSQYLSIPDTYTYVYTSLYNAGARVLSNSWGSYSSESQYTERQYDADNFVYKFPDSLIIFAAGNSGGNGYKSAYSPCTSKNVLCTGSVDIRDDASDDPVSVADSRVSYFSSLGPTFDGRNKPDIVATGFKIVSAMSSGPSGDEKSCATYETFGTSMAAPVVSGTAIILREYFIEQYQKVCLSTYKYCKSFSPSGYLLKAVLIHSAVPVARYSTAVFDGRTSLDSFALGKTPDSVQGYGAINLLNAVPATVDDRKAQDLYVVDAFGFVGKSNYLLQVEVTSSDKPLRVTIAWYDPPSAIGTAYNLLARDLNLYVKHVSSGSKWYGNNADYSKMDSINPQEQISISSPATGLYEVYVTSPTTSYTTNAAVVVTCHGSVTSEFAVTTKQLDEIFLPTENQNEIETEIESDVNNNSVNTDSSSTNVYVPLPSSFDRSKLRNMPLFGSTMSKVVSIPIDFTLNPMTVVCLESFEVTSSTDQLHSIKIDLNAALHGGSAAFILAVLLTSPNGELIQVGGYLNYASSDRLWSRMWPVQWASATTPPDGSSRYTSTRFLLDSELKETGTWDVCVQMLYDNWDSTHYQGTITINFIDSNTITTDSKTKNAFSSGMNDMTIALTVFGVGLVVALVIGLGFRSRAEVAKTKNQTKKKTATISRNDTEDGEVTMASIKRKKDVNRTPTFESNETLLQTRQPTDNENVNPLIDENSSNRSNSINNNGESGLWTDTPSSKNSNDVSSSSSISQQSSSGGNSILASLTSVGKSKYQPVDK